MTIHLHITTTDYITACAGACAVNMSLPAAIRTRAGKDKTSFSPAGSAGEPVASSAASAAHPSASAPAEIPTPVTSTEELYNLSK